MIENLQSSQLEISEDTIKKWQNIVDIMAELIDIPTALIMRLVESDIEVFVSSRSDANPYHPGDHEHFLGSGLYCETVINTAKKLLIPNALVDKKWKNNPDIKLNMISYLGFPIVLPDGKAFGTICVLDNKENAYSGTFENLIENFRDIIPQVSNLTYHSQRQVLWGLRTIIKVKIGFLTSIMHLFSLNNPVFGFPPGGSPV
ncbi:MAG: GAF domain-containing protein [Chloroflexi bacterium]|nr:GAF domain-containing protein [Chloroflexota bacterium]